MEAKYFKADTNTNALFSDALWADYKAAKAIVDQAKKDNEDDQRLVDEYNVNIRQAKN